MTVNDQRFSDDLLAQVSECALADTAVERDTELLLAGVIDSLGVVRIVDWIERELGIVIDPADVVLEHFESVDAMLEYLRGVVAVD